MEAYRQGGPAGAQPRGSLLQPGAGIPSEAPDEGGGSGIRKGENPAAPVDFLPYQHFVAPPEPAGDRPQLRPAATLAPDSRYHPGGQGPGPEPLGDVLGRRPAGARRNLLRGGFSPPPDGSPVFPPPFLCPELRPVRQDHVFAVHPLPGDREPVRSMPECLFRGRVGRSRGLEEETERGCPPPILAHLFPPADFAIPSRRGAPYPSSQPVLGP